MAPASTSQISAQAVQEHFGKYYVVKAWRRGNCGSEGSEGTTQG